MLVYREECGTQVQLRSNQDRLMVTSADPSYSTWQGVPCLIRQVPNHLSHLSDQSPNDTPESWDNRQPRWVLYHKGLPRHLGCLSVFSGGGPPYDPGGGPLGFSGRGPLGSTGEGPFGPLASQVKVPKVHLDHLVKAPGLSGPPGGGPFGLPGDPGSQSPPRQSFILQSSSTLDQSIADMNWFVRQPMCNCSYKCSKTRLCK